jgi:hypothetical protein
MFARTSRIEIVFRILVIVAILFNAPLNSFSVKAADGTTTPTETATEPSTMEPTAVCSVSEPVRQMREKN